MKIQQSKANLTGKTKIGTLALCALLLSQTALAHNKVVVIPLGSDQAPPVSQSKTVFITNGSWNGDLGGPAGADDKCQDEADNLPGSLVQGKVFRAWISGGLATDFTESDRSFTRSQVPYKTTDNDIVALNYADLLSGNLRASIRLNAAGAVPNLSLNSRVWTGLQSNGTSSSAFFSIGFGAVEYTADCNEWTSTSPGCSALISSCGGVGFPLAVIPVWSNIMSKSSCGKINHLY